MKTGLYVHVPFCIKKCNYCDFNSYSGIFDMQDAYFEKLYADTESLYRLDQLSGGGGMGKEELDPLPATAVALLTALAVAWVLIIIYFVAGVIKKKKEKGRV